MIYLFLADGFEETEALVPFDVLHRGKQQVVTVGVTGEYVTSSHNITVKADITLDEAEIGKADMVILPGGMPGTEHLDASDKVKEIVRQAYDDKKFVAAICAAPMVLGKMGLLKGRHATCFPGFEEYLDGAILEHEYAVRDGHVITARGAGAAYQFGFMLLECFDREKAAEVRKTMQYEI